MHLRFTCNSDRSAIITRSVAMFQSGHIRLHPITGLAKISGGSGLLTTPQHG